MEAAATTTASPEAAAPGAEAGASSSASMKNKVCAVCADRALGYNFNALTCESCKAFFRRNALKNKEFKCPFSDRCEVTVVTRRFCQKCRLKKCFDVGMKKEWILSDAEKRQKRQKIEENRAKRRSGGGGGGGNASPTDTMPSSPVEEEEEEVSAVTAEANASVPPAIAAAAQLVVPRSASPFVSVEGAAAAASERPQARVLPSARGGAAAAAMPASSTPSKNKVMRLGSSGEPEQLRPPPLQPPPVAAPPPPASGSAMGASAAAAMPLPGASNPHHPAPPAGLRGTQQFTLIKQELLDSHVAQQQQQQQHHHSSQDIAPQPVNQLPTSTLVLNAADPGQATTAAIARAAGAAATSPPPPPSVESVMLQPLVNAAAAMMATAPLMEHHHQQQQQQNHGEISSGTGHQPAPAAAFAPAAPSTGGLAAAAAGAIDLASGGASGGGHHHPTTGASGLSNNTPNMIIPDFSHSTNLDEIVAVAIEAEFHVEGLSSQPRGDGGPALNAPEKSRLEELYVASRALVEPIDSEKNAWNTEPNNLISVINLTDLAIKRIIRMTKKISPFISMCQEDQIALLKGGCTELMILRSVINYNPDKNTWRLPSKDSSKELSMELLKEASDLGVNLYEEHQRFVSSFDPRWRTDENVMLLLSAIALFNPQRGNVTHREVIKLEQDTYYYLLRRYLETACAGTPGSGCDARSAYLHLIGRLQDLHRLNDSHIQLFLEVNPKLVEPLLIEIFDLKPYSK